MATRTVTCFRANINEFEIIVRAGCLYIRQYIWKWWLIFGKTHQQQGEGKKRDNFMDVSKQPQMEIFVV